MIANGKPDAPPRSFAAKSLSYVAWSHGGRSYMLVARAPEQQVAERAGTLAARF